MADERQAILNEIRGIAGEGGPASEGLARVCALLRARCPGYDWVGFYIVDPEVRDELFLGPFAGAPTDHLRIPFGRGICGQAAAREETFVIDDVAQESNYLSCSVDVRSEIVVPVFHAGELVGELDIDSHRRARFSGEDRALCESVAACLGALVAAAREKDPES